MGIGGVVCGVLFATSLVPRLLKPPARPAGPGVLLVPGSGCGDRRAEATCA